MDHQGHISRGLGVLALLAGILSGCATEPSEDLGVGVCRPACADDQVCVAGVCERPGPETACGTEPYGADLPVVGVLYVDASHGGPSDGSADKPFTSVAAALAAPAAGITTIAIAEGSYPERLVLDRSITLRCRCAEKVRLSGGVDVKGSGDIAPVIDGCQIAPEGFSSHAPTAWPACGPYAPRGVRISGGPSSSVDLTIRQSVVGGWCVGVHFNAVETSSSALCIARSHLVANHKGLEVFNIPLLRLSRHADCKDAEEAMAVVSSRVEHNAFAGIFTRQKARGIALHANLIAWTGSLERSQQTRPAPSGGYGVYLGDTTSAHIHANRIRNNGNVGLGLINSAIPVDTVFSIEDNVVEKNVGAGIALQQIQATKPVSLRGNLVHQTVRRADGSGGDGIQISVDQGSSYTVVVKDNSILANARHGVFLDGVQGEVSSNTIGDNGSYGCLLQKASGVSVSGNRYTANATGDVHRADATVDNYAVLPVPLP